MYIKIINDAPVSYTLNELKEEYPNVSFPKEISEEILNSYGIFKVVQTIPPNIDSKTHRVIQTIELVDGLWTQVWNSVQLSQFNAEENLRSYRNNLLKDTDWVVTYHTEKGTSVPQEWLDYRQALRDITEQSGFPYTVNWPSQPVI